MRGCEAVRGLVVAAVLLRGGRQSNWPLLWLAEIVVRAPAHTPPRIRQSIVLLYNRFYTYHQIHTRAPAFAPTETKVCDTRLVTLSLLLRNSHFSWVTFSSPFLFFYYCILRSKFSFILYIRRSLQNYSSLSLFKTSFHPRLFIPLFYDTAAATTTSS